ncbi:tail fiber protein, partial [Salmonella enterica]|nr:tail fiber protein [Salmonella enterica]
MKPLMKSIDTPDQVFHDGDPSTGELGTICSAEWLNDTQASIRDIQAECIAILRANGFEPDETKRDQLWEAIQAAIKNHVPAASLVGAGIVQLSSSVTSDSETIAATLKAVKIAMDNANARLAKERNLADLTNVPLARQSLQLGNSATRDVGTTTGTVAAGDDARITGAMQRDRNGSDIPDKAAFCRALGLGALATSDGIDALIKSQNGADIPDKALFV